MIFFKCRPVSCLDFCSLAVSLGDSIVNFLRLVLDDGKFSLRRAIGHALKRFPFRRCVDDVVMLFAFDEILRSVRDGQILLVPAPNFKRGRQTDPPLCCDGVAVCCKKAAFP